jgi:hypothetical protein
VDVACSPAHPNPATSSRADQYLRLGRTPNAAAPRTQNRQAVTAETAARLRSAARRPSSARSLGASCTRFGLSPATPCPTPASPMSAGRRLSAAPPSTRCALMPHSPALRRRRAAPAASPTLADLPTMPHRDYRRGSRLPQPRRAAAVPDARAATPAAPLSNFPSLPQGLICAGEHRRFSTPTAIKLLTPLFNLLPRGGPVPPDFVTTSPPQSDSLLPSQPLSRW